VSQSIEENGKMGGGCGLEKEADREIVGQAIVG